MEFNVFPLAFLFLFLDLSFLQDISLIVKLIESSSKVVGIRVFVYE